MTIAPSSNTDDEIDLRAIALTLWKGRGLIIALTLIAALVAYAVSAWLLPKQYQAVAYVTVSQPALRYQNGQQDGGLSIALVAPDMKALPGFMQDQSILSQVIEDSRVAPLLTLNVAQLADETQVASVGGSQLRFQVTDTDPQRAAILATVWAEKAAEWIESNYGFGTFAGMLETQIATTQQNYAQTQSVLETFLAQDQAPLLASQLKAQTDTNSCLAAQMNAENSLLQRLTNLETRLKDTLSISESDALLFDSIRQDVASLGICGSSTVSLQPSSSALVAGISSSQGLSVIAALRQDFEQRIANTKQEMDILQKDILKLQTEIEKLDYQKFEYTRQRDQYKNLYTQLTFQQILVKDIFQQNGPVAEVSAKAEAPKFASAPNVLVNTIVFGMIGAMLGVFGTLAVDWWRKE